MVALFVILYVHIQPTENFPDPMRSSETSRGWPSTVLKNASQNTAHKKLMRAVLLVVYVAGGHEQETFFYTVQTRK